MRIRLHKSRTTTAVLVVTLVLAGTAASGAVGGIIKSLTKNSSNEQSLKVNTPSNANNEDKSNSSGDTGVGKDGSPSTSPGNSCDGRNQIDNSLKQGDKSNGQSADCGESPYINPVTGGGNFTTNQNITINAEDQSVPYDGKEHDVVYTVQPAAAICIVKYNGLSAKPVDKGMWDARIICDYNSAHAEKSVILTITDEVKKEAPKSEPTKQASVKRFAPIKVPFTLSSSKLNSKSMVKIKKLGSSSGITTVTVYGYAQPSGNKAADLKLSRQRAIQVANQIRMIAPSLNVKIKALGSKINSECAPEKNKCVIVK
jgi:outer membrane protein OmpA-like peptidoglycan-associated protein